MTIDELIGMRVRQARIEAGLTQAELGTRVASVLGHPWSRQALSVAEKGRRGWTVEDLVALGWVLGRHVGWFLAAPAGREDEMLDVRGGDALIPLGWAVVIDPQVLENAVDQVAQRFDERLERVEEALALKVEKRLLTGSELAEAEERKDDSDAHKEL